jgi:hypothetical protein
MIKKTQVKKYSEMTILQKILVLHMKYPDGELKQIFAWKTQILYEI